MRIERAKHAGDGALVNRAVRVRPVSKIVLHGRKQLGEFATPSLSWLSVSAPPARTAGP